MSEHTDKEILDLFRQAGSRNYAFNLLVREHQRRLYAYIRRMVTVHADAEDILQNVFLKAWKGLDRFREEAQLYSWLHRIAHNETINFIKKQRRWSLVKDDTTVQRIAEITGDPDAFSGDEIERKLQEAVMSLPAKQRSVFIMKYFEGRKYTEISTTTGTSVGALKSSYHIAVKKIEQHVLGSNDQTFSTQDRPNH